MTLSLSVDIQSENVRHNHVVMGCSHVLFLYVQVGLHFRL